jgi:hypothetical protein
MALKRTRSPDTSEGGPPGASWTGDPPAVIGRYGICSIPARRSCIQNTTIIARTYSHMATRIMKASR